MHIPDGFLDPKISTGMLGAAAGALGFCLAKLTQAITELVPQRVLAAAGNALGNVQMAGRRILTGTGAKELKKMAEIAMWVFAAQMFNFPVAAGTSGHLIGGVFAAVIAGPFAGTLVIAAVVAVQALVFGDGGLAAMGANIINMAVLGSFAAYYLYAGLKKLLPENGAIALSAWVSVMLAALACSLELGFSGTAPVGVVSKAMLGVHAVIGIAEALLTVILIAVFRKMAAR